MKNVFCFILAIWVLSFPLISFSFSYSQEQIEAFKWAYQNKIISQPNIQLANLNGNITRQAFSKMIVNYIENVAGIPGDISDLCSFSDENTIINDLKYHTKRICAYKIMGKNRSNFNPMKPVSRAHLGTVLSRVIWGDKYNTDEKRYYTYHINALKEMEIMKNTKNVANIPAKRGDVLIMLKRMYDRIGSNIYLNSGASANDVKPSQPTVIEKTKGPNESYVSNAYNDANVIYTGTDGTIYYYDDKFLALIGKVANDKGELDLANYLKIESEYFKNSLDQLSNLDDEKLMKSILIDINTINPDSMTEQEKKNLIDNFKSDLLKIINENKDKNNKLLENLESIMKGIKNDKFGLKEKYNKTKIFIDATNVFLDKYYESTLRLVEIILTNGTKSSEEGLSETFGLLGIALVYQESSNKYQSYIEKWGNYTIRLLGMNNSGV